VTHSGPEVLFQDLRRDEIRGWWWWCGQYLRCCHRDKVIVRVEFWMYWSLFIWDFVRCRYPGHRYGPESEFKYEYTSYHWVQLCIRFSFIIVFEVNHASIILEMTDILVIPFPSRSLIPIPFHSHSQCCYLFPFRCIGYSHRAILIPSHSHV